MTATGIRVIDAATTRTLLPVATCVDLMADAMRAVSAGRAALAARIVNPLIDQNGSVGVMLGSCAEPRTFGVKIMSIFPGNPEAGRPLLQGGVLLFDAETGAPSALVHGATLTAVRTAATSALSARLLARPDARTLTVLGYGVQAAEHLDAIKAVRDIARIIVWGRSRAKGEEFCRTHTTRLGVPVVFEPDAALACAAGDIVCTVTAATSPVVRGEWVRPGTHVILVGTHDAKSAEGDAALIARSTVFVDHREQAMRDAGEIVLAIASGAVTVAHVRGELGQLAAGSIQGRASPNEITLFKSIGLLVQDLVAGAYVADQARALDLGHYCGF